ncbi:MAG: glycosyltransferase family 39 protein [Hyphomicrobiaceae bacterium]|nr:glycosyltransferase family 39 protein [Hyphomicrobiaceae bacterium]
MQIDARPVAAALDFEARTRTAVVVLIAATTLLRLVFAASLGLGIDEAYTVATSRQLQMSYFDHPPLAWWLTWVMRTLTGSESALAVRFPFVAAFALTTWFTYSLARLLYGLRAGLWAAIAVNLPPVIAWTSGTWVLPDGPLYAALTGGAYAVARVLFVPRQSPLLWLAAGAAAGLAMLSKLHGVFLLGGVFLFLLTAPRYRFWLLSPWPYAGALLALAIFSPVLLWNAEHHWISFTFQAARGQVRRLAPAGLVQVVGGQMAYLLPLVWATLVVLWIRALRAGPAQARDWLLVCLASGPVVLFTISGLWAGKVLPHWAAPGYLMLFPLVGRELARALALSHRWAQWWIGLCAGTTAVLIVAVLALAHLPWPAVALAGKALPDPLIETIDWHDVPRELSHRGLLARHDVVVVSPRWHEAGKLAVALDGLAPVLCLSDDPRGFGVNIRAADFIGRDAVVIGTGLDLAAVQGLYGRYFDRIEEAAPITLTRAGRPAATARVFRAQRLHASGQAPDLLDPYGVWSRGRP